MSLRLINRLHSPLSHRELLDPTLRPSPEVLNPWAVFCAWIVDWIVAIVVADFAMKSWLNVVHPLAFDHLPSTAHAVIQSYVHGTTILLAPLIYFAIHATGMLFHGTTPGLSLFKHRIECYETENALSSAVASTVSIAAFGLPLLNGWVDLFARTQTHSVKHHQWLLSQVSASTEATLDLVEIALSNRAEEQDFKVAA